MRGDASPLPSGRKTPLRRSRKKLKAKGKFKAHYADHTKHYQRKRTDCQIMVTRG